MYTDRAVDIRVLLAQRLYRAGVFGTDADAQEMPHPAITRRLQRSIERALMGTEVKTVKVAMGVYEHGIAAHMENGKSAGARQLQPMSQQRFEQQGLIEIGLTQHLLALFEDPGLHLQHLGLAAFLRQVLHHLAHIGQA